MIRAIRLPWLDPPDPRDPRPVNDPPDPRDPRPVDNPRARSDALRQRLREVLEDAQAALTAAEETNRRLHHELSQMTSSGARRWLVGIRHTGTRAARVVRHPVWTTGTVVRGLLAGRAPATARRAVNHLRQRSLPLRLSSPFRRWFEHGEESLAIRWIGPINLRHRSFEALLCHAPAGVEYRVTVPDGSRFLCACAISPQVWQEHPPRVEFTIGVEVPAAPGSPWRRDVTVSIDPGKKWTDRRWHPVSIDLPANNGTPLDVVVTLSTRVASGPGVDNAWAIFGEPRFEWPRSTAEVRRSISTFASHLRTNGLRSSFQLLNAAGITTADAEAYPRWVAKQHAHRRGAGRPGAGALGAFLPTAHQRDRSRLQHRPAVAASLHRIGPTPGVPRTGSCACATMRRRRLRPCRSCASTNPTNGFRFATRRPMAGSPIASNLAARNRRGGSSSPCSTTTTSSRQTPWQRSSCTSTRIRTPTSSTLTRTSWICSGATVRSVLQARLVAGALPHVHVHVPPDGRPAAAC